jgi:lipopolysaccharide export LptBFGC system permease protein LptF
MRRPGDRLRAFAARLCHQDTMTRIIEALAGRRLTRRVLIVITVVSFSFSVLVLVMVAWILPSSNLAFRELAYTRASAESTEPLSPPRKGLPELTWSELRARIAESHPESSVSRAAQFQYHLLAAVSAMPMACALLAVTLSMGVSRRLIGTVVGVSAIVGLYVVLWSGRSAAHTGFLPPGVAAWLPNLVAVMFASALGLRNASRRRVLIP